MDDFLVVHFRREKNALEYQAEQTHVGQQIERFLYMGELVMSAVPVQDTYMFVNGDSYRVGNVTWSVRLAAIPGQPSMDNPEVMITLVAQTDFTNGLAPQEDFF